MPTFLAFVNRTVEPPLYCITTSTSRTQTSTLRRRINQRDWPSAANELRRWVYGGGKVLPGLVTRREAEVALLL
jgi:lysozyme